MSTHDPPCSQLLAVAGQVLGRGLVLLIAFVAAIFSFLSCLLIFVVVTVVVVAVVPLLSSLAPLIPPYEAARIGGLGASLFVQGFHCTILPFLQRHLLLREVRRGQW
jgi:hypothetical protein